MPTQGYLKDMELIRLVSDIQYLLFHERTLGFLMKYVPLQVLGNKLDAGNVGTLRSQMEDRTSENQNSVRVRCDQAICQMAMKHCDEPNMNWPGQAIKFAAKPKDELVTII